MVVLQAQEAVVKAQLRIRNYEKNIGTLISEFKY